MTTAELVPLSYGEESQSARGESGEGEGDRARGDHANAKDRKLHRRKLVAALTLRGWTQRDMAAHLGVSKTTIVKDQAWCREQWRERAGEAFDAHVAEQLHVLDRARAFDLATMENADVPMGLRQAARDGVHRDAALRARLMGLNAPEKLDIGVTVSIEEERERGLRLVHAAQEAREREAG